MSTASTRFDFANLDEERENPVPCQQGQTHVQYDQHDHAAQQWEQLACQHQDEDDYLLQLAGDGSTSLLTVVRLQASFLHITCGEGQTDHLTSTNTLSWRIEGLNEVNLQAETKHQVVAFLGCTVVI